MPRYHDQVPLASVSGLDSTDTPSIVYLTTYVAEEANPVAVHRAR